MSCFIEGCDTPAKARGMCNKHYLRWWVHGDPIAPELSGSPTCSIAGCDLPSEARHLCHKHYQRWKYRQNPAKFQKWERDRRAANLDEHRQRDRTRALAESPRRREASRRRKVRKASAIGLHSEAEWQEMLALTGGRCFYCPDAATTRDHVVPLARGGTDYIENIVPACRSCNSAKQARTPREWMASTA